MFRVLMEIYGQTPNNLYHVIKLNVFAFFCKDLGTDDHHYFVYANTVLYYKK